MKKIILIAYKIEKGKGSEDGTGYNLCKEIIQKNGGGIVISRRNNIEKLLHDPAFDKAELHAIDVPKWIGFFKRKGRNIILYYYFWQIAVGLYIRKLKKTHSIDVIHQVNFHATWSAHFIPSGHYRIIWGPLTHHKSIPFSAWDETLFSFPFELIRRAVKRIFWYCDIFLYYACKRSNVIFLGNNDITYPYSQFKNKIRLLPQAGSIFPTIHKKEKAGNFSILFCGRFVSLKGCILAINAIDAFFQNLPHTIRLGIETVFVGEGALGPLLRKKADSLFSKYGVTVKILDWMPQEELSKLYMRSSLFLYPSFEGQGLVVVEAMAHGCPVVCLDNTGPSFLAGRAAITIPWSDRKQVVENIALSIQKIFNEYNADNTAYIDLCNAALERSLELCWKVAADKILEAYDD